MGHHGGIRAHAYNISMAAIGHLLGKKETVKAAEKLAAESRRCVQKVLDTREMVEKAGMDVRVVSAGGTHNYEILGDMAGVTEIPAGSYALMDGRYLKRRPQYLEFQRLVHRFRAPSLNLLPGRQGLPSPCRPLRPTTL